MCVICKLWQMEKLTTREAKKATWEMIREPDADELHLQELYAKLEEQERQDRNETQD